MDIKKKIKVLIIDDTAQVREILRKGLSENQTYEVVAIAPDVYGAKDMIVENKPDVLILNIEMPKMDGIEFLRKLMPQFPLPVIVLSSLTQKGKHITLQALESGAVDFVTKPASDMTRGLDEMILDLKSKLKIASIANVSQWKTKKIYPLPIKQDKNIKLLSELTDKIIVIGASTGGTEAIRKIITQLPQSTPGIVIVQHLSTGLTKTFADRLNELSAMQVKEAETGDKIKNGIVLVAPGDFHIKVIRSAGRYQVVVENGEKVNGHRPSIDILMMSVAEQAGSNAYGILLTGPGNDGALGLRQMKKSGAKTIGQDEESSMIYGMAKVAKELGGLDILLPVEKISETLIHLISQDIDP